MIDQLAIAGVIDGLDRRNSRSQVWAVMFDVLE